ncbi:MAG TPA: PH domain-containing protein [Thermoanaerobaculia bacterium]
MSVEEQLQPGEQILYRAQTTRISLAPRIALTALAALGALIAWHASSSHTGMAPLAVALAVIGLVLGIWTLSRLLLLRSNEYIVTNLRLIQQTGLLTKRSMDVRLDKINNVEHRQTIWGRLLGFGDLEIDTASETGRALFPDIGHPLQFKRAILAAVEDYRGRAFRPVVMPPPPVQAASPASALSAVPPADRIRQLKKLLDEGLISPQEFEAKRRQALDEM